MSSGYTGDRWQEVPALVRQHEVLTQLWVDYLCEAEHQGTECPASVADFIEYMYYDMQSKEGRPLVPGEIPGPDLKEEYHWEYDDSPGVDH